MLPQGKAYQSLYKRLKHMEMIYKLDTLGRGGKTGKRSDNKLNAKIGDDINHYLSIFEEVNNKNKYIY